jgi:ABC-2 type transport system permease protein
MLVFKTYFRIIKANLIQMSIYLAVFIAMAIIFSGISAPKEEEFFMQSKTNIAFINPDGDTPLLESFKGYLSKYANFVDIENEEGKLQDALFYREVEYIARIPANFTQDFLQGKDVEIVKTVVPGSTTAMYIDMAVNRFFNSARAFVRNVPGITENDLAELVAESASAETEVTVKAFGKKRENNSFSVLFFNYLAYALFSVLILGVSANLMVFNSKNIRRRNLCSPLKDKSFNYQLIAANLVFALACFVLMVSFGFIIYGRNMVSENTLWMCANALVFTIAALSVSYLIGMIITSKNAQSAAANVVSLGLCILSGAFVPQYLLSEKVLLVASFNPTYWYVKANNTIGELSSFNFGNLSTVFNCMLIELGFAAAIFTLALVISKQRRIANA